MPAKIPAGLPRGRGGRMADPSALPMARAELSFKGQRRTYTLWFFNTLFFGRPETSIFGVWAAPGDPNNYSKCGGFAPPHFGMVVWAAGASQTPSLSFCACGEALGTSIVCHFVPCVGFKGYWNATYYISLQFTTRCWTKCLLALSNLKNCIS